MGATREIKLSGDNNLFTIVDEDDYRTLRLWDYKWFRIIGRTTTYVASKKNGKTIYLHRLIMGLQNAPGSVYVDHIDHNGLNNYKTNLRATDNTGNQRNAHKRISARNSSTYKGITRHPDNKMNPWMARIYLSGKRKYLGCYKTEEEAALSYNKAAIEYFGDMAYLNIIRP